MAPLPICYLNNEFLPLAEARISPLDRGFLFADSVYEVLPVFDGRPFRFVEHFARLDRSLAGIRMAAPRTRHEWLALLDELVERNGGGDMYTYVQVTRGAEMGRNHAFPAGMAPTVFAMAATLPAVPANLDAYGVAAITTPDLRWARCDIKSTALLPNILAKQLATDAGAAEAILVRDGDVMEGSSMSVFALIDGTLVTPPNSNKILPGTTRDVALELADGLVPIAIRKLPLADLRSAAEIWLGSATRAVIPVVNLDGAAVGPGTPGPVWRRLHERFEALKAQLAGTPAL